MRVDVELYVTRDPKRPQQYCVAVRDADEQLVEVVVDNLSCTAANRLLMFLRAGFMAGARWMRDNMTSHLLCVFPHVTCRMADKDTE